MARLIKDAAKLDKSIDANDMSFANIVKSINAVQTEMGITGTTALEAGRTISGSVGAMKSAWTNLLTGLADGNEDIGELVNNLVTTIVGDGTEENLGVFGNIMPAVKSALNGASRLVSKMIPIIVQEIPAIINNNLPILAEAAISIIESLANGISNSLPNLIPTIINVVLQIVEIFTRPETILKLMNAGVQLIVSLVSNIPAIISGIVKAIPKIITGLIGAIMQFVPKLSETGLNLIKGLWNGIKDAGAWLWDKISGFFDDVVDGIKDFFGIRSPSRLFRDEIGKMMAKGIGVGFDDEFANVKDDMEDALNFDDASVGINASIRKVGAGAAGGAFGGTSIGNITINIDGAKYSDEQSLASAIALEIQNMTDRRAAVYA